MIEKHTPKDDAEGLCQVNWNSIGEIHSCGKLTSRGSGEYLALYLRRQEALSVRSEAGGDQVRIPMSRHTWELSMKSSG